MDRWLRLLATVAIVGALLAPVALDRDSLPLSTYPMYASSRGSTSRLVTAQRVSGDARHDLSFDVIGASDDPLVITGELRAAIRGDRAGDRCVVIAERAVDAGVADPGDRIEIVTESHDTVAFVRGEPSFVERVVHASCEVGA